MNFDQINKVELDGNNNVVIQGVKDREVTVNTVAWDDFIQKYTRQGLSQLKKEILNTYQGKELQQENSRY